MPDSVYHHGTETESVDSGLVPIYSVEGAIVGIVGTAPAGAVNQLTICQTSQDFAQFGTTIGQGFTLPDAFEVLKRYGSGRFYAINVLDPAIHKSNMADEVLEVNLVTLRTRTAKVGLLSLKLRDDVSDFIEGNDYTTNLLTGDIQLSRIPEGVLLGSYDYNDPSLVTIDDIKGGYDALTHQRKGMELWREGFARFGADAKILIAPYFDEDATIARELEIYRDHLDAICYINAPKGITPSDAITGRGALGNINFNTADIGAHLFYGYVNGNEPLALHAAGLRMWVDVNKGYWHSISNHEIKGAVSVEPILTARIDKKQSETNLLNAQGITTIFNSYGTGYRIWGNRLASFPTETRIQNFEVVKRTQLLIDEAIRKAELQFVDKPIDGAVADSLLESVDAFGRDLTGDNKPLLGFKCWWSVNNSEARLAKGHYIIAYKFTPKVPGERITNESEVTSEYYGVLNSQLREQYNVTN